MGGVNRNNVLVGNYTTVHKSLELTTKVTFHFIEEAILNAFILFNKANPGQIRFIHFKLNIIKGMISWSQPSAPSYDLTLVGHHFLQLIPPTVAKSNPQKKCRMCCWKGVQKEICYQCRNCFNHPGLCPPLLINMQQIYRRTPMLKCDSNKVAWQLCWNHTSVWVFCCKFAVYL